MALRSDDRLALQAASQALFTGLTRAFAVGPCRVEVLAARPHGRWGELQGLYTEDRRGRAPRVQLWMRTARQRRVVAFRTYLRTLLHELCHHLDYTLLRLPDSLHTQGFYQRESSLFHALGAGLADGVPRLGLRTPSIDTQGPTLYSGRVPEKPLSPAT